MTTRADQKQQTRSRITSRAADLFARDGFLRTPTIRIARSAGLSHGALFVHFPSRDGLIVEVTRAFARGMTDRLHGVEARGTSLRTALGIHLEAIQDHEDLYTRFVIEQATLPPDARASWVGLQSAIAKHLGAAFAIERNTGQIRSVPHHFLFNTWIGLVHHYLTNRDLFSPRQSVIAEKGAELLDCYCELVTPKQET